MTSQISQAAAMKKIAVKIFKVERLSWGLFLENHQEENANKIICIISLLDPATGFQKEVWKQIFQYN